MDELPAGPTVRSWERPVTGGPVRVAVVGVGQFARNCILPALSAAENAECSILVTGTPDREVGADERVVDYEAYHEGVAADDYDAVYVATPNHTHTELVATAAELGKDVLCEKPMAATVAQARELQAACADAGVTLMVANRVQFKPTVRYVRRLIRGGLLGDPVHVHGGTSFEVLERDGPDQWRLDPDAGGGVLLDIGIYPLNTIRFLLDTEVTPRAASMATTPTIDEVDAHTEFHLDVAAGGSATCTASYAAHPASHLRLVGTDGVIHLEAAFRPLVEPTVTVHRGTQHWTVDAEEVDEYREQVDYFAQCVLRGDTPEPDGEEGVADMEVMAEIRRLAGGVTSER